MDGGGLVGVELGDLLGGEGGREAGIELVWDGGVAGRPWGDALPSNDLAHEIAVHAEGLEDVVQAHMFGL